MTIPSLFRSVCRSLLFLLAFGTLAHAADNGPIKIGHYASLTGKDAAFGVATRKGVLLAIEELNAAVFSVPEVRTVEYRMAGSCDRFWNWLQYGCQTVSRL